MSGRDSRRVLQRLAASMGQAGVLLVCAWLAGCSAWPSTESSHSETLKQPVEVLLYKQTPRNDVLGRIVVPVVLNEQGPFYFLLDTGATHTVLSRGAAERLGLPMNTKSDVAVRGVNGRQRVPTTQLGSLRVGDMEFRELRMPVLSAEVLDGLDGILSVDYLHDLRITADLARAEVRISDVSGPVPLSTAEVVKFSNVSRRLIMVDVWIGNNKVEAVIDTGGAHTLGNMALLKMLIAQAGGELYVRKARVLDATDTAHAALDAPVKQIRIGAVNVDNLTVSFGNFSVFDIWHLNAKPALLIGMDALSRMSTLSIDYRRKELAMTMYSECGNAVCNTEP